jgi:predicted nucleotidyltransferase component of viral defense system
MIPVAHITAWGLSAPWPDPRQIEQDLIIARAIVTLFADEYLRTRLRFRGGTALNKLHFPKAIRYSEDIDLVKTTDERVTPRIRELLEPWLGPATYKDSEMAPKLIFRVPAENGGAPIRLKIEINAIERDAFDGPHAIPLAVENPWFSGSADVPTFTREEMLATKLRALLQRDKGRDLFDLAHAHDVFEGLAHERTVVQFSRYLAQSGKSISRAQAEERMFAKLRNPGFLADMKPLLAAVEADRLSNEAMLLAFAKVYMRFVTLIPGAPWAQSEVMKERHKLIELCEQQVRR